MPVVFDPGADASFRAAVFVVGRFAISKTSLADSQVAILGAYLL
jgi:hypothetical protein